MLKALCSLFAALPEILEFIKLMQKQQQEKADNENLKQKMKKVNEAFKNKDSDMLNDAFNN